MDYLMAIVMVLGVAANIVQRFSVPFFIITILLSVGAGSIADLSLWGVRRGRRTCSGRLLDTRGDGFVGQGRFCLAVMISRNPLDKDPAPTGHNTALTAEESTTMGLSL